MREDDFEEELVPLVDAVGLKLPAEGRLRAIDDVITHPIDDQNQWMESGEAFRSIAELPDGPDWFIRDPPPRKFLLQTLEGEGMLPDGRVGMLAAAGAVGKTTALMQLALCVAVAKVKQSCWLDSYVPQRSGHVLLLLGEEELPEVQRKLKWAADSMRLGRAELAAARELIHPLALAGNAQVALTQEVDRNDPSAGVESPFSRRMRAHLSLVGDWALVVVDPLSRFATGDAERDNSAATRLVQTLEKMTQLPGSPAVLIAHHTRKGGKGDGPHKAADDIRGASALKDGVRWLGVLEELDPYEDAPRLVRFGVRKSNLAKSPPDLTLFRDDSACGTLRLANPDIVRQYKEARLQGLIDVAREKKEEQAAIKEALA